MHSEYPTDEEIKELVDLANKFDGVQATIDCLEEIYNTTYGTLNIEKDENDDTVIQLSTGGWSGNEQIVGELQKTFFWARFWEAHYRGGHYKLTVEKECL